MGRTSFISPMKRAQPALAFHSTGAKRSLVVKTLGVVGSGQMGLGIALTAARLAGVNVLLADNNPRSLEKSLAFAETLLKKDVAKGKLTDAASQEVYSRLKAVNSVSEFNEVDLVIEVRKMICHLFRSRGDPPCTGWLRKEGRACPSPMRRGKLDLVHVCVMPADL